MTATSPATPCPTRWTPRSSTMRTASSEDGEKMAALLRGAEHAAHHRHPHVEPHRPGLRYAQRAAARHLTVKLQGSGRAVAGGLCGARPSSLEVTGDANDYVGKGLVGGIPVVVKRPMQGSPLVAHENVIIGNTVL